MSDETEVLHRYNIDTLRRWTKQRPANQFTLLRHVTWSRDTIVDQGIRVRARSIAYIPIIFYIILKALSLTNSNYML